MNELIDLITQNAENIWNIQAYVKDPWLTQLFLLTSFSLLLMAAISSAVFGSEFFASILPFLFSEQYSLSLYRSKNHLEPTEILLGIFFIIQFSFFLFYVFSNASSNQFSLSWLSYIALFCLLIILFKFFVYRSLQWVLPKKVEVDYYGFNYIYLYLILGLILFFVNLYVIIYPSKFHINWLGIIIVLFYIVLIIRLISISLRYKIVGNLYIFLYFCTLEIAPIIIALSIK